MNRTQSPSPRSRRAGRILLAGIAALALVLSGGAVYQHWGHAGDAAALVPPGGLVPVGGHAMHLHCTGSGRPTVVLEAGNLAYSATWAWVQEPLSRTTRVCSYDRRGLGWSEDAGTPRDGGTIARELRRLLAAAGEDGPFVLVGHSLGGLYVRGFAHVYPAATAALVLVDPSHPEQFERWPEDLRAQQRWGLRAMKAYPWMARVGLLRATNLFGRLGLDLPAREYRTARHFLASPAHLRTAGAEMDAFATTAAQLRGTMLPEHLPVRVLSATEIPGSPVLAEFQAGLHAELATLTGSTEHRRIEGADHYTIVTRRSHATVVAGQIEELVLALRRSTDTRSET